MKMIAEKDERYQGVQKHSSGFKLLASMGWKEGEGLVGCKLQTMHLSAPSLFCLASSQAMMHCRVQTDKE